MIDIFAYLKTSNGISDIGIEIGITGLKPLWGFYTFILLNCYSSIETMLLENVLNFYNMDKWLRLNLSDLWKKNKKIKQL